MGDPAPRAARRGAGDPGGANRARAEKDCAGNRGPGVQAPAVHRPDGRQRRRERATDHGTADRSGEADPRAAAGAPTAAADGDAAAGDAPGAADGAPARAAPDDDAAAGDAATRDAATHGRPAANVVPA